MDDSLFRGSRKYRKNSYHNGVSSEAADKQNCSLKDCVCNKLKDLTPGTNVYLTIEGVTAGPFIFTSICKDDCCAAFIEPSGALVTIDICKIEGLSFTPAL
ncbi:hypothetical protein V1498_15825 [Peribacillus sp. SCS-26]|uniref:hypothetical protein n=1 Tax=Paraperibacillus marinus TaxID=3115295 RepID=UPI003905E5AA